MGKDNNSFDWKTLLLTLVVCVVMVLPVLQSVDGVHGSNVFVVQAEKSLNFKINQQTPVSSSCAAYFKGTSNVNDCRDGEVPLPAATWLFILALVAFVGLSNKKKV